MAPPQPPQSLTLCAVSGDSLFRCCMLCLSALLSCLLRITKGLAEKLQAGWTMLATTCPVCNTPLVREKSAPGSAPINKMYCVGCSLWVMREQDLTNEQKTAVASPKQTAPTAAATSNKPSTSASKPPVSPASSSSASASAGAARPSLASLESGLASLSDHASFDKYSRELRLENDGPDAEEAETGAAAGAGSAAQHDSSLDGMDDEERAIASYASRPNKTAEAARSNLDAYARSKAQRASRARAEEEDEFEFVPESSEARLQEHTSKVNSLSAKLGAKMMAGWTLMGDTCPNAACTCPLVRARGETVNMLCVNCGAQVAKHGETLTITKPGTSVPVGSNGNGAAAAASKAAPAAAPQTAASSSSAAAPPSSASAFRASTARPAARRRGPRQTRRQREVDDSDEDEESEEDEEEALMRQLQEEADQVGSSFPDLQRKTSSNTPPQQRRQQQQQQSQQQQQTNHFVNDLDDPYSLAGLPADLSDAATRRTTAAPVSAAIQKSENVSAKLGEKMMQGYALLGQCCPRDSCDCPLVRKRDGPLLCVSCGSTIIQAREHDPATQGPAGNEPGEDGWIAINPAAAARAAAASASSASAAAAAGAHRTVTPIKRLPSPSVTESFDSEHHEKKARGGSAAGQTAGGTFAVGSRNADSPSFQSLSPLVRSPRGSNNALYQQQFQQSQQAQQQQGSADSSGFPSPALHGQPRSRAQSMDTESAGLESIDPRLRMLSAARSQLGGQRGRFNAPHSRAPSLAAPNTAAYGGTAGAGHTSSAVFNAAAHMAFDRHGAPRDSPGILRSSSRSGGSSLEQSPRIPLATPPATPLPSMALVPSAAFVPSALQIQGGASSMLLPAGMHSVRDSQSAQRGGSRYPQSRHPSINVGSSLLQHQSSPMIRFEADPQPLAPLPVFTMVPASASGSASASAHALQAAPSTSSTPDLHHSAAAGGSGDMTDLDSVLAAAHQTLLAKLDEVRGALAASTDMVQCRELMATMRELFDTIQHIRQ